MIIIDTREQRPIKFAASMRLVLSVGDYTSIDQLHKFHIERKSPNDLYGTMLKGHKRFKKELLRAQEKNIKLVMLIECTEETFYSMTWPGAKYCKVSPVTVKRIIKTVSKKYKLKFVWCNGRKEMKTTILKLLKL